MILSDLFEDHLISALVWTMMHSLWQFSFIAVIMSVLLKIYQQQKATIRYGIAISSLAISVLVSLATFMYYITQSKNFTITKVILSKTNVSDHQTTADIPFISWICNWIEAFQSPIFIIWLTGVGLFAIKFIFSLLYVEFLSATSIPVNNQATIKSFKNVCQHFYINTPIRINESRYIKSPAILGFFKPVILFPVGLLNHLDIAETEAIIAHEIAHFVRKDFYINLIQTLVEVIFYYHPAIWWISANIKLERENCCDELAIGYAGDNIYYAKTLLKIQEINKYSKQPGLALHFSKKESYFSNRIKRILNMAQTRNFLKEKIITSILLLSLVVIFSKEVTGSSIVKNSSKRNHEIIMTISDTMPNKKESIRIQKKTNDQEIKIAMENGKVTDLEVDGKKIDQKDFDKYENIIAELRPNSHQMGNARMFSFGSGDNHPFQMRFGDIKDLDSMFSRLPLKEFEFPGSQDGLYNFGTQQEKLTDHLQKLQEHIRKMPFNFKGLDSMDLNFRGFVLPEIKEWQGHPDFKIFDFDGQNPEIFHFGKRAPFDGIYPDDNNTGMESDHYKNFGDVIGNTLNKDGLLIPGKQNKVELTGKYLKINGEKQPSNIWQKYKRIFEEESGTSLQKNSRLEFVFEGKESKRTYKVY